MSIIKHKSQQQQPTTPNPMSQQPPKPPTTTTNPQPDPQKLHHRKQQLHNLLTLLESVQSQLQSAINHNKLLNKRKADLEEQFTTYDIRLKSILKEKEFLFSRLMTVERDIGKLEG